MNNKTTTNLSPTKNNTSTPSPKITATSTKAVKKRKISVRGIVTVAAMAAAAYLLQILATILPFKVGGFLEIEFSDLPPIIASFALGPSYGVLTELLKNLLKCSMTTTGFVGEFANFIVNGIYVFTAGMIYKRNKNIKSAIISLGVATVVMTLAGIFTNLFIMLPLYMPNAPLSQRLSMVLTLITPFNLAKGAILAFITFYIYKPLSPIIKKR